MEKKRKEQVQTLCNESSWVGVLKTGPVGSQHKSGLTILQQVFIEELEVISPH